MLQHPNRHRCPGYRNQTSGTPHSTRDPPLSIPGHGVLGGNLDLFLEHLWRDLPLDWGRWISFSSFPNISLQDCLVDEDLSCPTFLHYWEQSLRGTLWTCWPTNWGWGLLMGQAPWLVPRSSPIFSVLSLVLIPFLKRAYTHCFLKGMSDSHKQKTTLSASMTKRKC